MQSVWNVEKKYKKNTANYLAVSAIFFKHTRHLDNPARPRLPSAVEKTADIEFFSFRQAINAFYLCPLCVSNQHKKVDYSQFDSKCSNCKKRQSWSTQFFYNISSVILAISILLFVLLFTIYGGEVDDTISLIILFGAFLSMIVSLIFMNDWVIEKLVAKKIKYERSIPEIVEVGEIEII